MSYNQVDSGEVNMPIYEYECPDCNDKFEQFRPIYACDAEVPCPKCAAPAPRVVSRLARNVGECGEVSPSGPGFSFG